jgi:serine protease SohB
LHYAERKSLQERVGMAASTGIEQMAIKAWGKISQQRFW